MGGKTLRMTARRLFVVIVVAQQQKKMPSEVKRLILTPETEFKALMHACQSPGIKSSWTESHSCLNKSNAKRDQI